MRALLARTWRRWWARAGLAAAAVLIAGLAGAFAIPLPRRLADPSSVVVEYKDGEIAHVFVAPDGRYRPQVRLDDIDPALVAALLRLEDRRFHLHPGVDPAAIVRAALSNLVRGRRVSGASTVTMQLVRLLEPRPRTLRSKLVEALRALQLELRLPKRRILEAYLQFAPYGGNLEGVEAASMAWFGHRPTTLSGAEIATLLAVPQDPGRRAPGPGREGKLRAARDLVAQRLAALGMLPRPRGRAATDAELLAEIAATPVPPAARSFPREAPHASEWLRARAPGNVRIRTTLDAGAQRLASRILSAVAPELRPLGIFGGAVVMVEHATGEVRALVGNLDFWDGAHGGQVVAFDAPRSPGSALKPFLYAMAIERGLAGPRTLVPDVPTSYGGYEPRNFDGRYEGLVRLDDALARSLNLPIIALLREIGVERFVGKLREMGVASLDPRPGQYGLSAAVGGLELTPLELAGLYATIARGGEWVELQVERGGPKPPRVRSIAPGAAWLTREALSIRERPDLPSRRQLTGAPPSIHWKTGTSFGHRDAWAVGSGRTFTAAVWVGNVDATPSRHLVGGEVAAPILFDLLEGLEPRGRASLAKLPPPDLAFVEVCALSGRAPTAACPRRIEAPALRSAVPTEPCPYHRTVAVDLETGKALAPGCREGRRWEARTFVQWPASVRRWLRDQDRALPAPPDLLAGCVAGGPRRAPSILAPAPGQVALLAPGVAAERQAIAFEAEASAQGRLSWFVDGEYLGAAPSDERVWWTPRIGQHDVVVTDEAGLSARRVLEVRARGR